MGCGDQENQIYCGAKQQVSARFKKPLIQDSSKIQMTVDSIKKPFKMSFKFNETPCDYVFQLPENQNEWFFGCSLINKNASCEILRE